jgi:hypothetical protein
MDFAVAVSTILKTNGVGYSLKCNNIEEDVCVACLDRKMMLVDIKKLDCLLNNCKKLCS